MSRNNISFFIDRNGISGGMEFPEIIVDAIDNSTVFLFIGSESSYSSRYVLNEVTYTYNKKGKNTIIPYLIDDSPLPRSLQFMFGSVNYRKIKEHPIKTALMSDIKTMLESLCMEDTQTQYGSVPISVPESSNKFDFRKYISCITDKHWAVTAGCGLQIAVLAFLYGVFFFLFQDGFVSEPPYLVCWWSNVILTTSLLMSIVLTILVLANKKKAFYAICALDVVEIVTVLSIVSGIYEKYISRLAPQGKVYTSHIYSTLNDIGLIFDARVGLSIFAILVLYMLHCVIMWSVLQLKKNNMSAWSLLK